MKILAIDIGGTAIKIGIFDESGNILDKSEIPTCAEEGGLKIIKRVISIIDRNNYVSRIGISSAGQINPVDGSVLYATDNIPGWTGMRIKEMVESHSGILTCVENDVNAAAIGEAYYGSGMGIESFICLTFGTGIGGAIIEGGRIYRGYKGSAAEFGHIVTHAKGNKCTCGGSGCYETYASTTALTNKVAQAVGKDKVNGREVFELINKGSNIVKNILEEWVEEVIYGLVTLTYTFNPSHIILGGGIMNESYILDLISCRLPQFVMPSFRDIIIKNAMLGNMAGLYGAFHLAFNVNGR